MKSIPLPVFPATIVGLEVRGAADSEDPWVGLGKPGDTGVLLQIGDARVFLPLDIDRCRSLGNMLDRPIETQVLLKVKPE